MEVSHSTHSDNLDISLTSIFHNVIFFAFVTVLFCTPVCRYGLSMLPYLPCYECSNFYLFSPFLCHSLPLSLYLYLSLSIYLPLFFSLSIPTLSLYFSSYTLTLFLHMWTLSLLLSSAHTHMNILSIYPSIYLSTCFSHSQKHFSRSLSLSSQVMYDPVSGPCLVEVGSRCHGGEGTWLPVVEECIGYSQLDATLSCYLRPDRYVRSHHTFVCGERY